MKRDANRMALCALLTLVTASLPIPSIPSMMRAGAHGQQVSLQDTQTQARKLWEQAVAAKGGRERLRQITSLYVAANLGQGFREYTLYVFPDYRFEYSYWAARERTDIEVSNVRRGITWWQLNGNPAKVIRPDDEDPYLILLPQIVYLITTKDIDPIPLRSRKAWFGLKRVDVVEVDA
jgi:hypothetical protein